MFLTEIEDFDYKPHVKNGQLQKGEVVLEASLLWNAIELEIHVPYGFVSDLASFPWYVMFLFKLLGKHQRGAILHDWIYRNGIENKDWCDAQFDLAMEQDGVKKWRRKAMIAGLKVGGHKAWLFPKEVVIV